MTIPASVMPGPVLAGRQHVDDLLERVAALASLLYTVQISLDSLVLDDDPSAHDHERTDHAQQSVDEALVQTRALGVAIAS